MTEMSSVCVCVRVHVSVRMWFVCVCVCSKDLGAIIFHRIIHVYLFIQQRLSHRRWPVEMLRANNNE